MLKWCFEQHVLKHSCSAASGGLAGFRELHEACRIQIHLSWYLSDFVVPNYGQQTSWEMCFRYISFQQLEKAFFRISFSRWRIFHATLYIPAAKVGVKNVVLSLVQEHRTTKTVHLFLSFLKCLLHMKDVAVFDSEHNSTHDFRPATPPSKQQMLFRFIGEAFDSCWEGFRSISGRCSGMLLGHGWEVSGGIVGGV